MPESNSFDFPGINVKWGQAAGGDTTGTYPNPLIRTISGSILINGSITLSGSTSGTLVIKPAAVAGTNTLTFPAGTTDFSGTGGSNQIVKQTSVGGAFTVATQAMAEHSDYATWASDTPTITASVGTFTTVSGTQRWLKIGKLIHVIGSVTITTNGTAGTYIIVTLPAGAGTRSGVISGCGRERNITGKLFSVFENAVTDVGLINYDNTYPGGNGELLVFSYFYEIS